jgi:hypothetical protein
MVGDVKSPGVGATYHRSPPHISSFQSPAMYVKPVLCWNIAAMPETAGNLSLRFVNWHLVCSTTILCQSSGGDIGTDGVGPPSRMRRSLGLSTHVSLENTGLSVMQ